MLKGFEAGFSACSSVHPTVVQVSTGRSRMLTFFFTVFTDAASSRSRCLRVHRTAAHQPELKPTACVGCR